MSGPTTAAQMRMERIERLLAELQYEVTRGMLQHEIDETIGFRFLVPLSRSVPDGVVLCEFHTRPGHSYEALAFGHKPPALFLVKQEDVPHQTLTTTENTK